MVFRMWRILFACALLVCGVFAFTVRASGPWDAFAGCWEGESGGMSMRLSYSFDGQPHTYVGLPGVSCGQGEPYAYIQSLYFGNWVESGGAARLIEPDGFVREELRLEADGSLTRTLFSRTTKENGSRTQHLTRCGEKSDRFAAVPQALYPLLEGEWRTSDNPPGQPLLLLDTGKGAFVPKAADVKEQLGEGPILLSSYIETGLGQGASEAITFTFEGPNGTWSINLSPHRKGGAITAWRVAVLKPGSSKPLLFRDMLPMKGTF